MICFWVFGLMLMLLGRDASTWARCRSLGKKKQKVGKVND